MKFLILWSPAVICTVWALAVAAWGRTDEMTVIGLLMLGISLAFHIREERQRFHDRPSRGRRT